MTQTFAEQLKSARAEKGLSQQRLSDWAHIPKRTIEAWETADRVPPDYVQYLVLDKIGTYKNKKEPAED